MGNNSFAPLAKGKENNRLINDEYIIDYYIEPYTKKYSIQFFLCNIYHIFGLNMV